MRSHRTHGEVIAVRAEADRAALTPLPPAPYLVTDRHLRRVGKDCLVSFEASLYSVPAARVRAGQRVELRVTPELVAVHALAAADHAADRCAPGEPLAVHPRAATRGSWVVDEDHWAGLPDGRGRATLVEPAGAGRPRDMAVAPAPSPLAALLTRRVGAAVAVARRPLASYQCAAGLLASSTDAGTGTPR